MANGIFGDYQFDRDRFSPQGILGRLATNGMGIPLTPAPTAGFPAPAPTGASAINRNGTSDLTPTPSGGGMFGDLIPQLSIAEDVAKSGLIGLAKGTLGVAGTPGDARSFGNTLIDKAGDYLGAPEWLKTGAKDANSALAIIGNPGS